MASSVLRATPFAGNTRPLAARPAARPAAVIRRVRADAAPAAAPAVFTPPVLDPNTPSPIFGGSTGGLLRKAQVRTQGSESLALRPFLLRPRPGARRAKAGPGAAVPAQQARPGAPRAARLCAMLSPVTGRLPMLLLIPARAVAPCTAVRSGVGPRRVRVMGRPCGGPCAAAGRGPAPGGPQLPWLGL